MAQPQQPSQQPFLGSEPAASSVQSQDPLARHNSTYGDWMAPAAAGVAGVGAGALGADAYRRHQQEMNASVPEEITTIDDTNLARGPTADDMTVDDTNLPRAPTAADTTMDERGMARRPNIDAVLLPVTSASVQADLPSSSTIPGESQPAPTSLTSTVANETAHRETVATEVGSASAGLAATGLGGLEAEGARETGCFMPAVVRHNTSMSVSALHVPGEFPKKE
ncbi:hypothetical protein EJ03DRAFT_108468 [Teratosphaeria nubilosa]|uniref:Uncharacterized protein n=1 Tax=Teratosphaeria nubilosa TaxID=161662 RepID=A0A6G1L7T6_9PEZI|nr:hypothetical protein EJ03DRAFT_108468 [Teratosphaeria nubilosa]